MVNEPIDRDQAVAMHSVQDQALARRVPKAVPEGWEGKKFTMPRFPTDMFAVVKPDGSYWGPFMAHEFVVDPATNIATAHDHDSGAPVVVRILTQSGSGALCIDDSGEQVMYDFNTIPDNTLDIEEPGYGR